MDKIIKPYRFQELSINGYVIDGFFGGLVLGPSHDGGGIPIYTGPHVDGYRYLAEMEGCEFLFNVKATVKYEKELIKINDEMDQIISGYQSIGALLTEFGYGRTNLPYMDASIYDQNSPLSSKIVVMLGRKQFIMNKFSSLKYFDKLYAMNLEGKK